MSADVPILSSLDIAPDISEIGTVSAWLEEMAERHDWPAGLRFGLELSVEEALANVINHGFKGVAHAPLLRLEHFDAGPGQIGVRIIDNGVAFDPTAVRSPDLAASVESAGIGGHGVRLMRHYLRGLSYRRVDDHNELTLIAGPKSGDAEGASPGGPRE